MSASAEPQKESLFVWQCLGDDGRWGQIGIFNVLTQSHGPLTFRDQNIADWHRPYAMSHKLETGQRVRLVRYDEADILEEL